MRREIAHAVAVLTQEVRPTAHVTAVGGHVLNGYVDWSIEVFYEPGHSDNWQLRTLQDFALWLAQQRKRGFVPSL